MERDGKWLDAERNRVEAWPREQLLGWLQWNDPNGSYDDPEVTHDDLVDNVMAAVEDNLETPEEMMTGSLQANPGRYPKPAEFDPWLKGKPMPPAPKRTLTFDALKAKDPQAAEALFDLLGSEAHDVEVTDDPEGYLARHVDSGELWDYDGAQGFWQEV